MTELLDEPRPETLHQSARRRARRFMVHPVTELVILLLIVLSVGLMLLELAILPPGQLRSRVELAGHALTSLFVVELAVRYWTAHKKTRFFERYWIDIIAVLPVARPLRLFRGLRVLRMFRAGALLNRRLSLFRGVFQGTATELVSLLTITIVVVLAATAVLQVGEGAAGDFSRFETRLWYSLFSMMAGEPIGPTPTSDIARWTTLFLMLSGLTVFGMFVGTVSAAMAARLSNRPEVRDMDLDELTRHVVICGWNRSGPTVVQELLGPGSPPDRAVIIVTEQASRPSDLPNLGGRAERLYHYCGDYTRIEVLEEVGITEASTAILLTDAGVPRSDQDRDARTVLAALTIERLAPRIYTVAELTSRQSEAILAMAGVEEVVVGDWYAGVILGSASRNRGLVAVLDDILTTQSGSAFYTVTAPKGFQGCAVHELSTRLLDDHGAVLISVRGADGALHVNPDRAHGVEAGDRLVVLARQAPKLR